MRMRLPKNFIGLMLLLPLSASLASCTRDHKFQPIDMWNDSRLKPYEQVNMPAGTNALAIPAGSIARGQLRADDALYLGKSGGKLDTAFPFPITEGVLKRGQERYTVYCTPCHGGLGDGKGIVVTRGFSPPPDYTLPRLMNAPVGHFYDVITNGYGAMYSYAARVPVNDRWAITAYIRVLQKTRTKKGGGATMPGGGVYSPELHSSHSAAEGEKEHGRELSPRESPEESAGQGGRGSFSAPAGTSQEGASGAGASGGMGRKGGPDGSDTSGVNGTTGSSGTTQGGVPKGVAPGSRIPETGDAPGGAAEGANHEKAVGGERGEHSPSGAGTGRGAPAPQ